MVLSEVLDNVGKNILDSRAELIREGKKKAYILKGETVIAVIGYKG